MKRICRVWVMSVLVLTFTIKAVADNGDDPGVMPENAALFTASLGCDDGSSLDDTTVLEAFTGSPVEERVHDGIGDRYRLATYGINPLEFKVFDFDNEDAFQGGQDGFEASSGLQGGPIGRETASRSTAGGSHRDDWIWTYATDPDAGENVGLGPRALAILGLGLIGCFAIVRRRLMNW